MQLEHLKKSVEDMTDEELMQQILEVRKDRRTASSVAAKPKAKKEKASSAVSLDFLKNLLGD